MTGHTQQSERRGEVRRPNTADHICWTRETANQTFNGWISDVASTSLSFLTATRDRPNPGETIDLTIGSGGHAPRHQAVTVVRAAPYDQYFSLVGCRSATECENADGE